MAVHGSDQPTLTAELRKYIADRILRRLRDREVAKPGSRLVLIPVLFKELLDEACDDACADKLLAPNLRFDTSLALMLDDMFYEDVRWRSTLSASAF